MKPMWPMKALCLLALVATVLSAAVPAKDEYVVFATNNRKSRTVSTDETTDKPFKPVKMTEMRVRSEIALRYARTSVITHVTNPDSRSQEATFRMLLPETAFIAGFTMILSGKSYKAYVKEKEEAKQIYTQAVSQGLGAAHVATKARDSNHFTVSVNVEGNTTAVFDMRYEEFLFRRNGCYNHVINLHPGVIVPNMQVDVHIKESQKITTLRVPEVRTGNEIDATEKDPQNSIAVITRGRKEREATITFTPDEREQRRLAAIYVEKTKEKSSSEKFIGYSSDEDEQESEDGKVLGQFVVQYDVERNNNGEILVNDGYFVHFLSPSSLPPLSKKVVFVLDTSGSMAGRKIEQLREAMIAILSDLNPHDFFNIVEFNSYVKVHDLKEADEEPPPRYQHYSYYNTRDTPVTLVPASPATPENIAKAKVVVNRLYASGGTNIQSALEVGLKLVRESVKKENGTKASSGVTEAAVAKIEEDLKKDQLEPIIIFLTDGDPTVGETSPSRIISSITEQNTGQRQRGVIHSLAFGEDADRGFLRKISLKNDGFMRHIYEGADAAMQLHDFYRQISSPLLSGVTFTYPEKQIKEGSVSRTQFRTINEGSEVAVVGRLAEEATELTPEVSGFCGDEDGAGRKRYRVTPKVAVNRTKDEYLPLERLWAYLTIKQLLDKRDAGDDNDDSIDDSNKPEKKALAIALKYEFVTPLTSLVVVKPEESNAVDVESVDKISQDASGAFIPLSGPPSAPNNAYLTSFGASYAALPGLPGPPASHAFYASGVPLALDAAAFSDIRFEDEADSGSGGFSGPVGPSGSFYQGGGGGGGGYGAIHGSYGGYGGLPALPPRDSYFVKGSQYTTTPPLYTTYLTTPRDISPYHLEHFDWTSSLLNDAKDSIVFNLNGTEVILKLSRDVDPPKADDGDSECSSSKAQVGDDGAGSVCVYITRCYAARSITALDYQKSYCVVNNRYAGVCCARSDVDKN
ncbi:inter-alpha-trypsin inhibitor heavy chain H4 isoform X5 [Bicyclus anynana]|uniref:Inter-alpha-trypsin inhibitor heavy chain H4 isoform X5 n=1 Tax=Bicyclus anynana TaxID=110368 RepID=A0ABM3M8Y6_BICAN|nr:inter-alpha-trypsin inhibitor heavy chain H4 isoform X5 [Bicyclus anynana]